MLGTPFELLEVTDDIHQDNAKGTTKIVGDFLILQDCDEFKALFFKNSKWAGGNMMLKYRYVIKDRNEEMVMINMTKFTNMKGVFFKMDNETNEKIMEILLTARTSKKRQRILMVHSRLLFFFSQVIIFVDIFL